MLKVVVGYPDRADERRMLDLLLAAGTEAGWDASAHAIAVEPRIGPGELHALRSIVQRLYMDDRIRDYILAVVDATRPSRKAAGDQIKDLVRLGASPRATLSLAFAAKAHAFLRGRAYVTPEDVKAIGPDVLRHRVALTYEAEADEVTTDQVVRSILDRVAVP